MSELSREYHSMKIYVTVSYESDAYEPVGGGAQIW